MIDLAIRIIARRNAEDGMSLPRVLANLSRTTGIDCMSCQNPHEARARVAANTGRTIEEAVEVARETNAAHAAPDSFTARLEAFVAGCAFIKLCDFERFTWGASRGVEGGVYPLHLRDTLSLDVPEAKNARYARVWMRHFGEDTNNRIYCFVDMKGGAIDRKGVHSRGSVLKFATYKKPAPHARGDIMADDFGLSHMGPHGTAYLV